MGAKLHSAVVQAEPAPVAVLAYGRDVDEILGLVATAFRPRPPPGEAWT